jgi:hypothetical protein
VYHVDNVDVGSLSQRVPAFFSLGVWCKPTPHALYHFQAHYNLLGIAVAIPNRKYSLIKTCGKLRSVRERYLGR